MIVPKKRSDKMQGVPKGYKQTILGIVPSDWEVDYIGKHSTIQTGNKDTQDKVENGHYPFFVRSQTIETINSYNYNGEAVLTSGDGVGVGKIYHYINGRFDYHQRVYNIHNFSNSLFGKFFYYYFSKNFHRRVNRLSAKNSVDSVRLDMIARMPIPLPPLPEQQKIAEILGIWDEAIEKTQSLVDHLRQRNRGLAQQLLTGKKRLPAFVKHRKGRKMHHDKWPQITLGKYAKNLNIRNKGLHGTEKLFAVTKKDGVVPMREQVKGLSFENCKIVRQYNFAYNPMRINIGSIAMWEGKQEVMVSGDYVVFECDKKKLLPHYLECLRKTILWQNFMLAAGNGSVRIRIYFSELAHLRFPLPAVDEQQAIVDALQTANDELKIFENKLSTLREQKKGLMQKLLTGRVRVTIK